MPEADLRLGIDVGGTNVDAVIVDGRGRLVAKAKGPSTGALASDAASVVRQVLAGDELKRRRVTRAMIGARYARRALLERRGLRRVAVVRIGSPLTHAIPPLATWPEGLRRAVSAGEAVVGGGAEYDGREAAALDEEAIVSFLDQLADAGVECVAITSVFSPVAPGQELAAAEVVRRERGPATRVSLSHEIGSIGLVERENATVLNAALAGAPEALAADLREALAAEEIEADLYLSKNDGTAMTLEHALGFPVLTIGSGPANGMRGAAHLSGAADAVVVDAGGLTTEVGALVNGFPSEAPPPTQIAGVRMSFPIPDVRSLPFGGGSVIDLDRDPPSIHPESVGVLERSALVFGGGTPTLTDAAVAAGRATLGSDRFSAARRSALCRALVMVDEVLADLVDRVRAGLPRAPVVAVGGAGMLVPDGLAGAGEVIRPADGEVAGAIGAATAHVSGEADRICPNRNDSLRAAREDARAAACARAVSAGADPDAVEVVRVEEIPLPYLVHPAVRIRVKAAGPAG